MKVQVSSPESAEPTRFHIHVDATKLTSELARSLNAIGMTDTNFDGHPRGYPHFEPFRHMTKKFASVDQFRQSWAELVEMADRGGLEGYLEAEAIRSDLILASNDAFCGARAPFRVERRRLSGRPGDVFRETELHLTMDRDLSDPRLVECLLEAGLYGAWLPKAGHTDVVLTAQGGRKHIGRLLDDVATFVQASGGASGCTLKEERIVGYRLYGVESADLPEVVNHVIYY